MIVVLPQSNGSVNLSKKDLVMKQIIKSIAEGRYKIGEKLPPERALAEQYGISRIIVHSAIVELHAKGLLIIAPRKGITVADYKRHGNIDLLEIILTASEDQDNDLLISLLDTRLLLEKEFAALASVNRNEQNIKNLQSIIKKEEKALDIEARVEYDFALHHEIAHASANTIYPLLIKSMEHTYKRLIREFYTEVADTSAVVSKHKALLEAVIGKNPSVASNVMSELLEEGASYIKSRHGLK
ncbi:MAG: FadR family transcriptional regulator [Clostridia bacterium]|nr:FadR family transcriptional regulator [Clostridia bacterium]